MRDQVRLVEVGPRDGLQNESSHLPTNVKIELIRRLFGAGIRHIEAGAFVSPKWVPQMADSAAVIDALNAPERAEVLALVPNEAGLKSALASQVETIAVFTAASETFSKRNTNCSIEDGLARLRPVVQQARDAGRQVRGYVSCIVGCPYEGRVPIASVVRVAEELFAMGCDEIALGDTNGVARPAEIRALLKAVTAGIPASQIAIHVHDTYGMGLANVLTSLELGLRSVDASVAGLGGCPYAPGASGNVATEDVVYLLEGQGLTTGIDLDALIQVGTWICNTLGRVPSSRVSAARSTRS
ncbi:hydroxymethylglutaryl-CoA lyase [Microvirga roseola]|uniref:hydroxymethylglutaryl-CoA lyase n=1 Tax=Microvirga roseola TaxID=2883126 RepID=UPI001E5D1A4A|nr:hydroxymethylglutaryl-CoA lyase [Microvirga roseola]